MITCCGSKVERDDLNLFEKFKVGKLTVMIRLEFG